MWKLRADGYRLFLEPDVKSAHGYTVTLLILVAFMAWNRCFGYMRAEVFSWSRPRRYLLASLAPILPWVRVLRLGIYLL